MQTIIQGTEFVESLEPIRTSKRLAAVSRLRVDFQQGAPQRIRMGNDVRAQR